MSNFIGLVYGTLKQKGIDTSNMSVDEAIEKFNELEGNSENKSSTTKQNLTTEQKNALEYYVSGNGMYVNNYLAGRVIDGVKPSEYWSKSDEPYLKALDDATTQQEVEQDVLYRSVDASAIFPNMDDFDFEDFKGEVLYGSSYNKDKTLSMINEAKNKTLQEPRFMSTTKDKDIALDFGAFTGAENPVVIEFEVPKGVKGVDLQEFDVEDDPQKEVLLQRNLKYKITDITKETSKNGNTQVYFKAKFI